jgi:ATP-binding cassette subfamily F protein uup
MAILVNANGLSKSFGARPLFSGLSFSVESGQRIGLIGPNGAGKSTLLKIIAGISTADEGTLSLQRGLKVSFLEQVPIFQEGATVFSTVMEGSHDPHEWEEIARAQEILSKLSLGESANISEDTLIADLSGGWRKRVALARELMRSPDLLLLDEPTNHLDVESILWLEELLNESRFATITITHDRVFLQRVSNRILELDRRNPDGLLSVYGDYAKYLELKTEHVRSQEQQEVKLKNTLRREMEWLRRGAKARTTKQQARIQRAGELQDDVAELTYRNQVRELRLDFQGSEKNPKKLVEALNIQKNYDGKVIVPKTSLLLTPKSRVALLGPNGCGKSTLVRMLVRSENPDFGTVFHSDQLKVSYFEQHRDSLDPETTLLKSLCPRGDHVDYQGTRVHVRGYLDRFNFRPEQHEMPVARLSGGEQSRLLIAKLMLQEANLLVMDEPTNDLDLQTLDILAEVLQEFKGAVLLVTHDRYFLSQVANLILAFGTNPKGEKVIESFINLEQWEAWHENQPVLKQEKVAERAAPVKSESGKKKKLSYKDQRELDGMEAAIKAAEDRLAEIVKASNDPANASNARKLTDLAEEMAKAQKEVDRLYARWAELEKQ